VLHTPLGFEYASHLTVDPALNTHGVTAAAARAYWRQFETRAHALPSVQDLALVTLPPLGNRASTQRAAHGTIAIHQVQPSYFTTMSIPVLRGRTFSDAEPGVAMVSESFARAMWPREDPLGQTYDSATVVGVVGNAATLSPGNATAMEFYRPLDDTHLAEAVLVVRVHGDPKRMVTPLATLARAIDPHAPASIETLAISFDRKLRAPEQASVVMSVLGVTALGLGAVGFGGLIAFTVSQRIREIGIRLALGAERVDIVRALMSQFTRPVAAGAIGGFVCAAAVATILRAELFGLNPFDPLSYGAAVVLFVVTGMATAAFPIRRALRVDPVTSLRCE
jgi:putative ABC transport system permease protein